jgi:hypothetical protein
VFDGIARSFNGAGFEEQFGYRMTDARLREVARMMNEREEGTGTAWLSDLIRDYLRGPEEPEPAPKRRRRKGQASDTEQ